MEWMLITGIAISFVAFTLSACAGLGGSLILLPAMIIAYGTKEGIAIAAMLLAFNNIGKVIAYRKTIPFKAAIHIILLTMLGAAIGAKMMLAFPAHYVDVVVIVMMIWVFAGEFYKLGYLKNISSSSLLAFLSGCTSGISGTSGPLKGLAIRKLNLQPLYFVGAASAVSLAGDVTKASIFARSSVLGNDSWVLIVSCMVVSVFAVITGKHINSQLGTRLFTGLFWLVITGYMLRLILR